MTEGPVVDETLRVASSRHRSDAGNRSGQGCLRRDVVDDGIGGRKIDGNRLLTEDRDAGVGGEVHHRCVGIGTGGITIASMSAIIASASGATSALDVGGDGFGTLAQRIGDDDLGDLGMVGQGPAMKNTDATRTNEADPHPSPLRSPKAD